LGFNVQHLDRGKDLTGTPLNKYYFELTPLSDIPPNHFYYRFNLLRGPRGGLLDLRWTAAFFDARAEYGSPKLCRKCVFIEDQCTCGGKGGKRKVADTVDEKSAKKARRFDEMEDAFGFN
jgi:hypothetical protein